MYCFHVYKYTPFILNTQVFVKVTSLGKNFHKKTCGFNAPSYKSPYAYTQNVAGNKPTQLFASFEVLSLKQFFRSPQTNLKVFCPFISKELNQNYPSTSVCLAAFLTSKTAFLAGGRLLYTPEYSQTCNYCSCFGRKYQDYHLF
jgi:hypothetical protein